MFDPKHFRDTDRFLADLQIQKNNFDPLNEAELIGLLSARVVTTFEICVKDIFYNFANNKHIRFGDFVTAHQRSLNGNIKLNALKGKCKNYGEKYKKNFLKKLDEATQLSLQIGTGSPTVAYDNMIGWRNSYIHAATLPTATFQEAINAYAHGKIIIDCLDGSMYR